MAFYKIKDRYPPGWRSIAATLKERAAYTCAWCGVRQGELRPNKDGELYAVVVTVAHLDRYDTANPQARMAVLCQTCHLDYDRDDNCRRRRLNEARRLHEQMRELGQQYLPFGEGELAGCECEGEGQQKAAV